MARKPTTKQQKVIRGTFRKDRDNGDIAAEPLTELPDAPSHLDKDAVALYNQLGEFMIANSLLYLPGLFQLVNLCDMNSEVTNRGRSSVTASHVSQIQKLASDLCLTTPTLIKHGVGRGAGEQTNPFAAHGKKP